MMSKKAAGPNSSVVVYTFGPGPLGVTLEDAQGGTRVIINEVSPASQAARLGVPVGGTLINVNGRTATGRRKAHVGKLLATDERPLTIHILHPGGPAAAMASDAEDETLSYDEFAVPARSAPTAPPSHPAASLGPITSHVLTQGLSGLKGFEETDSGVQISSLVPGSAATEAGLAVGGIIVSINGEEASLRKAALAKQLANADLPTKLLVVNAPPKRAVPAEASPSHAVPTAEGGVAPYLFGPGPMGLTFSETPNQGVVIGSVTGAAEALQVPVGGVVVRINKDGVAGKDKATIGKLLAKASRPVTLMIRPGASAMDAVPAAAHVAICRVCPFATSRAAH